MKSLGPLAASRPSSGIRAVVAHPVRRRRGPRSRSRSQRAASRPATGRVSVASSRPLPAPVNATSSVCSRVKPPMTSSVSAVRLWCVRSGMKRWRSALPGWTSLPSSLERAGRGQRPTSRATLWCTARTPAPDTCRFPTSSQGRTAPASRRMSRRRDRRGRRGRQRGGSGHQQRRIRYVNNDPGQYSWNVRRQSRADESIAGGQRPSRRRSSQYPSATGGYCDDHVSAPVSVAAGDAVS
jgi:hypothetical protein